MKNKREYVILILIATLALSTFFIYNYRNKDEIEVFLTVKNETEEKIDSAGVLMDNKILLNRTSGEVFYFPKEIFKKLEDTSLIVILKNGEVSRSGKFSTVDNKEVTVQGIEEGKVNLDIETVSDDREFNLPNIDKWNVKVEGRNITGEFKSNTDLNYTLYLLGKGGHLGMSDKNSKGALAIASWEKPRKKLDSWVLFEESK
ncbi:hypothetical protein [Lagierella sp.]|uniref:hypothetical protein n=1 Tax=Lagierella sp. TaxID=2849657 RepID=UPI002615B1CC|nr:hypothetical protein [Lagierella sp.]